MKNLNKWMVSGALLVVSPAAFANLTDMKCDVVGKNLSVDATMNYDEGSGQEEGYANDEAKRPFYHHMVNDATLQDKDGNNQFGTVSTKGNFGYFRFDTYDGTFLPPLLKIDFKNDEGTRIVIQAVGHSAPKGNPQGNAFQTLKGKMTLVIRGKDRDALKRGIPDLRNVKVVCNADTD